MSQVVTKEQVESALDRLREKGLLDLPREAHNLALAAEMAGVEYRVSATLFGWKVRVVDRLNEVVHELVTDGQRRRFSVHDLRADQVQAWKGVGAGFMALALEARLLWRAREASDV